MTEAKEYKRKLTRVGGSVMVALPKDLRRMLDLGVGDRVQLWSVKEGYIIIQKEKGVRDGNICLRD